MDKVANRKLSRRMDFRGLKISIETDKGELRHWYDPHSKTEGTTKMKWPYGYIRRTESSADHDHVDVYVGPNEKAKNVYVVNQMKAPNFKQFDEQKVFLAFDSAQDAKTAYLAHYNDPRFFGSMFSLPFETFKEQVLTTLDTPKLLKAAGAAMTPIKIAYAMGAAQAVQDFEKNAASLGDPMFWQGGQEAAQAAPEQGAQPPSAEDAALALPPGIFQGLQMKVNPAGERSTTVKVTPDALGAPDVLAGIFQAEPAAKIEMSMPQAGGEGGGQGGGPSDLGLPDQGPVDGAGAAPVAPKMAQLQGLIRRW